ncbi:MAG: nucleotidyltransferase domain-containing protein [Moheibacter sp.]
MILSDKQFAVLKHWFLSKPINKAYFFGSFSRNEANEYSDIDILVELDHTEPIGLRFFEFQEELKELLGKEVDLITEEGLSKYVRPFIEKDKILIYEK